MMGIGCLDLVLFALYFVPMVIALLRQTPKAVPICAVNILLGWTVVGWLVALAWALSAEGKPILVFASTPGRDPAVRLCSSCGRYTDIVGNVCPHCDGQLP
jgi:hypothetical protein